MIQDNSTNNNNTFKSYAKPKKIGLYSDTWKIPETKMMYHGQRLEQSGTAFRLSFYGSIAGFIIIVLSLFMGFSTKNIEWIGVAGGAVTECVSALFYILSNESNKKISEFFQELTKESNINHAIALAYSIENDKARDDLLVKLSLHLSGISDDKVCELTTTDIETKNI